MKQLNWYQIFGNTHIIPDGRTVTPTDDIQTLLHCANIWDKDYTTLAEVLADDDTLFLICISNNAIDYLVRSTTWASINGLVPTMTSNTTPSGIVSSNSVRTNSNYPWNAFNGIDNGGGWCPTNAGNNLYVQYKFESATLINSVTVKSMNAAQQSAVWSLKASNDGVTFVELTTVNEPDPNDKVTKSFGNTTEYQYYRLEGYFTNSGGGVKVQLYSPSVVMSESAMQYIGASDYASETLLNDSTWNVAVADSTYYEYVLNVKNPKMTGYTTPKGEVFQSSVNGSRYGWYAFDDTLANFWASTTPTNSYIGYRFAQLFRLRTVRIVGGQPDVRTQSPKNIIVQCSSDGITYNDVQSIVTSQYSDEKFAIINNSEVSYWRLFCTDNYGAPTATAIREINFYGREIGGVQSWLAAGGIKNKKYTTVSEVLSDLTTLATLMASSDAIDYLVTAKGWATEICSDSNAMADIGMNNYAANTLLADETWGTAICTSTYFKSVLNVENPDMTSDTQPYGVASASSRNSGQAYNAFDGDTSTTVEHASNATNNWVRYKFPSDVKIYKMTAAFRGYHAYPARTMTYQYSTDGVTYVDAGLFDIAQGTSDDNVHIIEKSVDYCLTPSAMYYGIFSASATFKQYSWLIDAAKIKFYGRKDI